MSDSEFSPGERSLTARLKGEACLLRDKLTSLSMVLNDLQFERWFREKIRLLLVPIE